MLELVRRGIRARWMPHLVLVALAFAFTAAHAHEFDAFSPYDEYVYYDYVSKVPGRGFVVSGDQVGDDARNELSCRGVLYYGSFGEACDSGTHLKDELYPYGGGTGADIYAPPYFTVTWVLAQPFTWLGSDLVDASRWVGGAWLAMGLGLTFALLRTLRVTSPAAFGLTASMLSLPAVYWATQYVSTDAPTIALSAALGLAAVATARCRVGPWLLPLLSVIAVLFKVQNLAVVGLAASALLTWTVLTAPPGDRWRSLTRAPALAAAGSIVAGVFAQAGWLIARRLLAISEPVNVDTSMSALTPRALVDEGLKFLRTIGQTGLDISTWAAFWAGILGLLGIGAVVAAIIGNDPIRRSIGIGSAFTAVTFGPALAIATTILVGHYIPLPSRYGLVLLVAVVLCSGWLLDRNRISRYSTGIAGFVVGVASIALV